MKLSEILNVLRGLAPEHLAEPWDKVGLQIGGEERSVRRAMLCIDLTPEVMAEAVAKRVGLVVSYHPLIFKPLDGLRENYRATWQEKVAVEAVRRGIAVYSPHTALDAARGGVNDWLCSGLGKGKAAAIKPHLDGQSPDFKIVTFVPLSHADRVRQALFNAGAGGIGKYENCSFNSTGQGTFQPGAGAKPFLGSRAKLEKVDEVRIEVLCPNYMVSDAIVALREAHPYEEPAFDIFPRSVPPETEYETVGQGRSMLLAEAITLDTLLVRIKRHLKVPHLEVARPQRIGLSDRPGRIKIVDVCAGAGASILPDGPCTDACLTGEMKHHDILKLVQAGKIVILAGHTQTERPYLPVYRKRIIKAGGTFGKRVEWLISRADKPPSVLV